MDFVEKWSGEGSIWLACKTGSSEMFDTALAQCTMAFVQRDEFDNVPLYYACVCA